MDNYLYKELRNIITSFNYTYPEASCIPELNSDHSLMTYLKSIAVRKSIIIGGNIIFHVDGIRHSENDEPSAIYQNGDKYWERNGNIHRDTRDEHGNLLPAIIYGNGARWWCNNGIQHRNCKDKNGKVRPVYIGPNGYCLMWYNNGRKHRECTDENGLTLPAKIMGTTNKYWYNYNRLHRGDMDGNGKLLPSVVEPNVLQYHLYGVRVDRDGNRIKY